MSRTQRLTVVLVLNLILVAGLVAVGVGAHSLAVLAEGGGYLLDAVGVGVALLAIRISARPASGARPDGHPNATSIAALVNGGWLLVLEVLVEVEGKKTRQDRYLVFWQQFGKVLKEGVYHDQEWREQLAPLAEDWRAKFAARRRDAIRLRETYARLV